MAKRVAMGDADPVTLLPMEDINPSYTPRIPLKNVALNTSHQGKGKAKATPGKSASTGILQFFGTYTISKTTFIDPVLTNVVQLRNPRRRILRYHSARRSR